MFENTAEKQGHSFVGENSVKIYTHQLFFNVSLSCFAHVATFIVNDFRLIAPRQDVGTFEDLSSWTSLCPRRDMAWPTDDTNLTDCLVIKTNLS